MRSRRVQLSRWTLLLLICWGTLKPLRSAAQGSCAGTIQTETHNTVISGNGSGTYTPSLPQYNSPSGYTLISAVLSSHVTTTSTVKFQNTDPANEQDFSPSIGRTDVLKLGGTTLGGASSTFGFPFTSLDPAGGPGDNITYGPQNVFNNTAMVYDSVTAGNPILTGSFQGIGSVSFSYKSTTSLTSALGVSASPTVSDAITLSVTYYFCNPTILSSNVVTFTATLENNQTVSLNWITVNEQPGRRYEIEVSSNGKDFTSFDSQASDPMNTDASYSYHYPIGSGVTGKLYFRLKQVDTNGIASYSQVRIIDLGTGAGTAPGFSIYPNPPSDYLNLLFPSSTQGWQVDIFSADGSLVQRNYYGATTTSRLNFQHKLATGTYFTRATDLQTAKSYVAPFVIR